MSTLSLSLSPPPFQWPTSDEIFHLAPFLTLDQHTISPVYYLLTGFHAPDLDQLEHQVPHDNSIHSLLSPPNPNHPKIWDDASQHLNGPEDDSGDDDPPPHNESDDVRHIVVPDPCSSREAYLLLEAARVDRCIVLARKSLAHQIIHRNTLVLQYNRLVLERTQDDLRAADRFVGQVRFLIRKSGQSVASEYAMQEDHLPPTSSEQPSHHTSFNVDLT